MDKIKKVYEYAEPNLTLIGWIGTIGFPAYYFIWHEIFPQPYENLWLRLFCSALFSVIALRSHIPYRLQKYLPYFYVVCVSVGLPFFFSFMMFKNQWSTIWGMSFMASAFLHILLVYQTWLVLLQALLSVVAAFFLVYGIDFDQASSDVVWAYVPIFLFTYVFGNLCYFRNQVEHETKVSIAKSFGASIAHEMRNPLSAVNAALEVLASVIPNPKSSNKVSYSMSDSEVALARDVLHDAKEVIRNGNEAIDLLLASIDQNRISTSTYKKHFIGDVLESAVQSYSYKQYSDDEKVYLNVYSDFSFFGNDTLLKYVVYNLLKNSFYYKSDKGFRVDISVKERDGQGLVIFRDNGVGIEKEVIDNVFTDFYTFGKTGSFGLGLPFCKRVLNSIGGDITCRSEVGQWTEFSMTFPLYESDTVLNLKRDLIKNKSILLVSDDLSINKVVNEQAFYNAFNFEQINVEKALCREEFEFEYDVIVLDLDYLVRTQPSGRAYYSELQNKLNFTEGKVVVLYNSSEIYRDITGRYSSVVSIEKMDFIQDVASNIDTLMFDDVECIGKDLPRNNSLPSKTIMIADDNHSFRNYTSLLLEQQGFHVLQAWDGVQALEVLQENVVDLVLMDIEMPVLSGIETTNEIRSSINAYRDVPILGYTGHTTPQLLDEMKTAGMNDYIEKPAELDTLLDKIASWI